MKMKHRISYLVADVIVEAGNGIVLIKRKHGPFKGYFALPAGFVEPNELVENAAIREVKEETGLDIELDNIVGVYSKPDRDPRGDVVSICFRAHKIGGLLKGMDDASIAKIFKKNEISKLKLAFDNSKMVKDYFKRVKYER